MDKTETENCVQRGDIAVSTVVTEKPWEENCYLIRHLPSGDMALIDPGGKADSIIQAVQDAGGLLRHVLLTHAHHDHIGAVASVCRRFDLACALHEDDARLLRHSPMYALRFDGRNIETPAPFLLYKENCDLRLGTERINVIHSPGHTRGSVCYSLPGMVFTGDTLLHAGAGRTDLPGGDAGALPVSISRLLELLDPDTVIFPGHGRSWTLAEARVWWAHRAPR